MVANIATLEDLQQLRRELVEEIRTLLSERQPQGQGTKWLKSHQVMRLLAISPGTLQHLRVTGVIPFTKVGGVIFYDPQDIENMLQLRKQNVPASTSMDNLKVSWNREDNH